MIMTCNTNSANSIHRFRTLEQDLNVKHKRYYSYDKAVFTTMLTKFIVTCPLHGDFLIAPAKHLSGQGCVRCSNTRRALARTSSTEEFVAKALKVAPHFDYSKVLYSSASTKVNVVCPHHGDFWITPNKLLAGRGCVKCKSDKISTLLTKPVTKFAEQLKTKYDGKYSVIESSYTNAKSSVTLVCHDHGQFTTTPDVILNRKNTGCPACVKERIRKQRSYTTDEFVVKAKQVHNSYYTYASTEYINNSTAVWITCPKHGNFLQAPANHLAGKGCVVCNVTWKYVDIPTTLYYLCIVSPAGEVAYKIGITTKALRLRYYKELQLGYQITPLLIYQFLSGETAFTYEQQLLRTYRQFLRNNTYRFLHRGGGDTELFSTDITKFHLSGYSEVSAPDTSLAT